MACINANKELIENTKFSCLFQKILNYTKFRLSRREIENIRRITSELYEISLNGRYNYGESGLSEVTKCEEQK